jgi:hypothetical protein
MEAGVGHPVGVSGRAGMLVIDPRIISSESSTGVRSVFSGGGPAPDTPGTVESIVFASILQNIGFFGNITGFFETKAISLWNKIRLPA